MRKAVGYTRVSTSMQSLEGVSLGQQEQRIREYCQSNNYELLQVHVDAGLSGGKLNRPALKAAMEQAVKERAVLVVYSLSRLSRRTVDCLGLAEELVKGGSGLKSLSESVDLSTPSGLMVYRMMAVMSEAERDQLRHRVKASMAFMRTQNRLIGSIPYGFDCLDGQNLKPNGKEQKVLADMRTMRAKGKSLNEIVDALNKQGILTKTGKAWRAETVRRILIRNQAFEVAA
jgi:site-specific DNA recombinase